MTAFRDYIADIPDVIEDARNGHMFILVDAEDRENEGDLIIPAQMCTPQSINFMAKHGRGLICLAVSQERADQLKLHMMAPHNGTRNRTAFTVSIEAKEGVSTGISAHDRAHTIAVAIDPTKGPDDIVMPGHVFPLIARHGGVLVRAGHTEAAVDIARLAGLYPAGVVCEVMNDDGTMARLPDLVKFAQHHGLKVATIADLIAYRRRYDHFVQRSAESEFESRNGGKFKLIVYVNTIDGTEYLALVKGDISGDKPVLVRMHALNVLFDVLASAKSADNIMEQSMRMIGEAGRGVVVLLRMRSQPSMAEAVGKKPTGAADEPLKEYGIGAQILLDLGVKNMVLLTNTPERRVVALEGYGLKIVDTQRVSTTRGKP
jgi:3,4-dihydroxy 2-butanone 4-phosphate synthase / GTP cyclohydrolase II